MKKCPNCAAENRSGAKFCERCGADLRDVPEAPGSMPENAGPAARQAADADLRQQLVNPGETIRASIGNNYMQSFLSSGGMARGAAILTEQRLYYFGKSYSGTGKDMVSATEEAVIPIESITLSRFIHHRDTGALIFGILLALLGVLTIAFAAGAPLLVAGCISLVMYFVNRSTIFEVCFAGGKFCFNMKWYPMTDMQDFQRQIHLLKDHKNHA